MKPTKDPDSGFWVVMIQGDKYEFEKFGALAATDYLLLIASIVGGPLGEALANMFGPGGKGLRTEVTPDFARQVMKELSLRLRSDRATIMEILQKLSSWHVHCNGKPIQFDTFYQDRLHLIFEVARANLEVQYGPSYAAVIAQISAAPTSATTSLDFKTPSVD